MRLYLHWPFCLSRCTYCDFNSRVSDGRRMREYMAALLAEITARAGLMEGETRRLRSIYLGGGTPSTLSGEEIAALVGATGASFGLREGAEITVEVNPAAWNAEDYAAACAGGVNRLSIGVQSLSDDALRLLGRKHDAAAAMRALAEAGRSGAPSVSADLLLGVPGEDDASFLAGLREVIAATPQHVSLYALTLSAKSPLSRAVMRGEVAMPEEDEVAEQYLAACAELDAAGYEHYEISNFCLPGHGCRHNMAYWTREEYLGVGAGAHSFLNGYRFHNTPSLLAYMRAVPRGLPPAEGIEYVGEAEGRAEEIILGLRTARGVPRGILAHGGSRLGDLEEMGLLAAGGGRVHLTARGMLLSNAVIAELLPA